MSSMYNLNIERALLSAILFEPYKEEIVGLFVRLKTSDFYLPFHQHFFTACRELEIEGKPIDDEFIKSKLSKSNEYDEVGMLDVMSATPISNTTAYANDLISLSQKRSLAMIASNITHELVENHASPLELIDDTIRRIEMVAENGTINIKRKNIGDMVAKEQEFLCKNWIPIPKGTLSMFTAPGGTGKALCNNEKVLTTTGWVPMGEITLKHKVIGSDGTPKNIEGIFQQGKRDIYKVTFIDGTSVMCDLDHLWTVSDRKNDNGWRVLTTREIVENGVVSREKYDKRYGTFQKEWRYGIPFCSENQFGSNDNIKIHPYLMGVILGDGCITKSNITISNKSRTLLESLSVLLPEGDTITILKYENGAWYASIKTKTNSNSKSSVALYLEDIGLLGLKSEEKFIPMEYFTADLEYRKLLVQGLIDTDGYIKDGQLDEYSTSSKLLADGFLEIGRSIGMQLSIKERVGKYKKNKEYTSCKINYRIRERFRNAYSKSIVSIGYSHNNDATCIKINAHDSLFVTAGYNLTHNTWLVLQLATRLAQEDKNAKIFLWLSEDPDGTVRDRHDAIQEKILHLYGADNINAQIDVSTDDPLLLLDTNGGSVKLSSKFYAMKRELREYDIIVIDPLLAFYGGDENNNSQARIFMQPFLNWCRREGKTIIFLHHSKKGDSNGVSRSRGAGAIIDAVRCVYDMEHITVRKNDKQIPDLTKMGMRRFTLTKDNYGAARFTDGFTFDREITPKKGALAVEVEYVDDNIDMPHIV